jgi:hypothetical protein
VLLNCSIVQCAAATVLLLLTSMRSRVRCSSSSSHLQQQQQQQKLLSFLCAPTVHHLTSTPHCNNLPALPTATRRRKQHIEQQLLASQPTSHSLLLQAALSLRMVLAASCSQAQGSACSPKRRAQPVLLLRRAGRRCSRNARSLAAAGRQSPAPVKCVSTVLFW